MATVKDLADTVKTLARQMEAADASTLKEFAQLLPLIAKELEDETDASSLCKDLAVHMKLWAAEK